MNASWRGSYTRVSTPLSPATLVRGWTHTPNPTPLIKTRATMSGGRGASPPLSHPPSLSHLLLGCQLLLQLPVLAVPHQTVDGITTLLRSSLGGNHPRIIVCLLFSLRCGSRGRLCHRFTLARSNASSRVGGGTLRRIWPPPRVRNREILPARSA